MEFQFPANPSVGDTVTNPLTGTTYVWSDKGRWKVNNVVSQSVSIFEGSSPPPLTSQYQLWFDTTTETLKYFYCDNENNCNWVTTAFGGGSNEALAATVTQLSSVIMELQTKVTTLENTAFILME